MDESQVQSQNQTYWCGPTAMQAIGWGSDQKRRNQSYWARRLGTTSAGTAITDMVRVVNNKTDLRRRDARRSLRRARHQRLHLQAVVPPDDAPHPRLPGARRAPPGAAQAVLPLPRRRRERALPGRPRLRPGPRRQPASSATSSRGTSRASTPASRRSAACSGATPTSPTAPTSTTSSTTSGSDVRVRTTLALALLLVLTGCGSDGSDPGPDSRAAARAARSALTAATPPAAPSTTRRVVEPTEALLDWNDTGVLPGTRYVKGPGVGGARRRGRHRGRARRATATRSTVAAGGGRTISEVLMSADWAVVVKQDKAETEPSEVVAVDLATGEQQDVVVPRGGERRLVGAHRRRPLLPDVRRRRGLLPGHRRAGRQQRRGRLVRPGGLAASPASPRASTASAS